MPDTISMQQPAANLAALQITETAKIHLAETAKWARFLSFAGFVTCCIVFVAGFFGGKVMDTFFASKNMGPGKISAILYIAFAAVFFFPCWNLFRFSTGIRSAVKANDNIKLQGGLKNLRSCFKFMGILTITILTVYGLSIIAIAVSAVFAR